MAAAEVVVVSEERGILLVYFIALLFLITWAMARSA